MSRAPFVVIDGKAYRWKDILELRRAQLAAAGAAQASQLALFAGCTMTAADRRAHGIGALFGTKLVRTLGRATKESRPHRRGLLISPNLLLGYLMSAAI